MSSLVDTSKKMTSKLTGADDPNNASTLAQAGRLQNSGTDVVAGAADAKSDASPVSPTAAAKDGSKQAPNSTTRSDGSTQSPATEPMTIAEMQRLLAVAGYHPGPADGVLGKRSVEALKKFQVSKKLPPTGALDAETSAQLRQVTKTK